MIFKKGDIVKCINASDSWLTHGREYKIKEISYDDDFVILEDQHAWYSARFELVCSQKN